MRSGRASTSCRFCLLSGRGWGRAVLLLQRPGILGLVPLHQLFHHRAKHAAYAFQISLYLLAPGRFSGGGGGTYFSSSLKLPSCPPACLNRPVPCGRLFGASEYGTKNPRKVAAIPQCYTIQPPVCSRKRIGPDLRSKEKLWTSHALEPSDTHHASRISHLSIIAKKAHTILHGVGETMYFKSFQDTTTPTRPGGRQNIRLTRPKKPGTNSESFILSPPPPTICWT